MSNFTNIGVKNMVVMFLTLLLKGIILYIHWKKSGCNVGIQSGVGNKRCFATVTSIRLSGSACLCGFNFHFYLFWIYCPLGLSSWSLLYLCKVIRMWKGRWGSDSMQMHANKLQQLLMMGYLHGSGLANGQFINLVSEVLSEGLNSLEVFVSVSTDFTHGYAPTT